MKQVLGLIEIGGLSTTVVAADAIARIANTRVLEIEDTKGLGYMTIKITGDMGAVNAAVNTGKQIGTANDKLASWKITPGPSGHVEQAFRCPESPVPPSPSIKEVQEETGTGKTGETMRGGPETVGESGPDGGQADSVREETDPKDEPQAKAERPSEEEDFKLMGKPERVSRRALAAKGIGTAGSKNSQLKSGVPIVVRDGRILRERGVKGIRLAKIIGTVMATREDNSLAGYELVIIRRIDGHGNFIDLEEMTVDYVRTGVGETVLISSGSLVRVDRSKREIVVDMTIIGVIDTMNIWCNHFQWRRR